MCWVPVLQALAVPIVAIVGTLIAFQQMCIARRRLQMDAFARLYEQRKQVFVATREILAKVYGSLSEDDIRAYGLMVLDAKLLFDSKLSEYLKLLLHYVKQWEFSNRMAQSSSGDEKIAYGKMKEEASTWIRQQGDELTGFEVGFRPFLIFEPQKGLCRFFV
jgi:hypothetical protein